MPHSKNETRKTRILISLTAPVPWRPRQTKPRNSWIFSPGDSAAARFQEFWTFQLQNGAWLLREVEQSRESDKLKEENFVEMFTDKQVEGVYAETASPGGPAGPWLEKSVETKASRIERLLNFLVQTDKMWNR